jgi:thiol-disulfide isomerase/thioredoxin
MKRKILSLAVIMLALFMSSAIGSAENSPPKVGSALPEIELLKPHNSADLKYLGLSGSGFFKINQIKARVVIIEIFSMYCPYCQAEAPNVNRLYALIEGNSALKDKIKIIGIGINNSLFETDIFKKKYKVEFPLIPDGDFKLHKIIGEVRTPYFIVVKLNGGKSPEVIYSRLGAIENNDLFLAQIVKSAGLK